MLTITSNQAVMSSSPDHLTTCPGLHAALLKKLVTQDDIIEDLYADCAELSEELHDLQWQCDQLVAQNVDLLAMVHHFELSHL